MLCANNQISSNIKINGVVFIPFVSIPSKTTWTYSHRFMPLRLTMQMRAEIWIPATDLIGLLLLCWTVQLSYWIYIIYLNGYHFVIFCHILSYFVIYVVIFCHILSYVMTPMNALFDTLKLKHFRKTNSSYIETKNWTNPFRVLLKNRAIVFPQLPCLSINSVHRVLEVQQLVHDFVSLLSDSVEPLR